jgi:phenylalanyl-tRNA synthetase beta chain
MGLGFDGKNVIIPCYRTDIMHPIDIVEDVAIAYGYQNFEPMIPKISSVAERLPHIEYINFIKDIMIGLGFQEVVTMILTNKENEFERMNNKIESVCEIANSLSSECTICRKNILPSLLRVLTQNMHREFPQKIFEIGEVVVLDNKSETGARNFYKLGCVITDSKVGYENIASILDSLMKNLNIKYRLQKTSSSIFIKGRVAEIFVNNKSIGIMGEIHPTVLENWKLEMPVVGLELNLNCLFEKLSL